MRAISILAALAVLLAPNAASAAYSCTAALNAVLVYGDGSVMVNHSGRNDLTTVCNLNNDWKSISPSTCAVLAGLLNSAKRANASLIFYYDGAGSCAALPTYGNAPAPVYIGLQ